MRWAASRTFQMRLWGVGTSSYGGLPSLQSRAAQTPVGHGRTNTRQKLDAEAAVAKSPTEQ